MQKHDGIYSIDYFAHVSGMKSWNSGFKALLALITLVCCIMSGKIYAAIYASLMMSILIVKKGKLSIHDYAGVLKVPLSFMILSSIAIAAGNSKGAVFEALKVMIKAFGAVCSMYMMTLSTPADEIIMLLKKLKIPSVIIELMTLIYRYIFILMEVQFCMKRSAESRLGYCDYKTSLKTFGSTLGNLFIISLKKADAYYNAMESRCFDGEILFIGEKKEITKSQKIWAVFYYIVLAAVMIYSI